MMNGYYQLQIWLHVQTIRKCCTPYLTHQIKPYFEKIILHSNNSTRKFCINNEVQNSKLKRPPPPIMGQMLKQVFKRKCEQICNLHITSTLEPNAASKPRGVTQTFGFGTARIATRHLVCNKYFSKVYIPLIVMRKYTSHHLKLSKVSEVLKQKSQKD